VYSEDQVIPEQHNLIDIPGWKDFQDSVSHITPQVYLFDIKRFSHKVYAQLDAFESNHRYIVWLDADVIITGELKQYFLKKLVKGYLCAYLGRQDCYTETGFIIFDTKHEDFPEFKRRYRAMYDDGELFLQNNWTDCLAFDASRKGLMARNLTPEVRGMVDVFSQSPLNDVMTHDKGLRKYRRENEEIQKAV
jgi:hypothetical protein